MKQEWKKPTLEVLEVEKTQANPKDGNNLDFDYPAGTPREQLTWS